MNYITATVLRHETLAIALPSVRLSPTHLTYCSADVKVTSDNYVPTVEFTATYVSGDHLNIPKNLHFVLDTLLFVVNIRRHYCLIG